MKRQCLLAIILGIIFISNPLPYKAEDIADAKQRPLGIHSLSI